MREIKFRAWALHNKEMYYQDDENYQFFFRGGEIYYEPIFDINEFKFFSTKLEEDTEEIIVMQYTGLTDDNGKEIYEGDICTNEVAKWEIIFNKGCFCAKILGCDYPEDQTHLALRAVKGLVKIGNIYENPELLNEKPSV